MSIVFVESKVWSQEEGPLYMDPSEPHLPQGLKPFDDDQRVYPRGLHFLEFETSKQLSLNYTLQK